MEVILHRLAEEEYVKASKHFYRDAPYKCDRFRSAVQAVLDRIRVNPSVGSPSDDGSRWMKAKPFNYIVYYKVVNVDRVKVFAVAHASRKPGYWLRRTRKP